VPGSLPPKRLVVEQPNVQPRTGHRTRGKDRRKDGEHESNPLQEPSLRQRASTTQPTVSLALTTWHPRLRRLTPGARHSRHRYRSDVAKSAGGGLSRKKQASTNQTTSRLAANEVALQPWSCPFLECSDRTARDQTSATRRSQCALTCRYATPSIDRLAAFS